eukprot:7229506-Prorocentrum_lima.AAC.1
MDTRSKAPFGAGEERNKWGTKEHSVIWGIEAHIIVKQRTASPRCTKANSVVPRRRVPCPTPSVLSRLRPLIR